MRSIKNIRISSGEFDIGDTVIAIHNGSDIDKHGRAVGFWDYRAGDIGTVVSFVENMGYYIKTDKKMYNGVYKHSWKRFEQEV